MKYFVFTPDCSQHQQMLLVAHLQFFCFTKQKMSVLANRIFVILSKAVTAIICVIYLLIAFAITIYGIIAITTLNQGMGISWIVFALLNIPAFFLAAFSQGADQYTFQLDSGKKVWCVLNVIFHGLRICCIKTMPSVLRIVDPVSSIIYIVYILVLGLFGIILVIISCIMSANLPMLGWIIGIFLFYVCCSTISYLVGYCHFDCHCPLVEL